MRKYSFVKVTSVDRLRLKLMTFFIRPDDPTQQCYEAGRKSVTTQNAGSSNADPWFGIKPS